MPKSIEKMTLTEFAAKAGISLSYASQLMSDLPDKRRQPSVEIAADIYRRTGVPLGVLNGASKRDALAFVRVLEQGGALPPLQ